MHASRVRASVTWTIKERDPRTGLYLPRLRASNVLTDVGLTNLAESWLGSGTPPVYLIIDAYTAKITDASLPIGSTTVHTDVDPHKAGDVSLVLGAGTVNQETVTFSAVSGTGPYAFTISATTKSHVTNDPVVRLPLQSDVMGDIKSEMQYDAVAAPNKRMKVSGAGFSGGTGNWVGQFFLTGSQALGYWSTLGLSESDTVGAGTLHDHLVLGYQHDSGNDVEMDISLTLSN